MKALLASALLASCNGQDFIYVATLGVPETAVVDVDGERLDIVDYQASFSISYDTYDAAVSDDVRTISVWIDGALVQRGAFKAGACKSQCSSCPPLDSLIREEMELPYQRDFGDGEFHCASCNSADSDTTFCVD